MARTRQVVWAKVVVECDSDTAASTKHYVVNAVKGSCRNIRDATAVVGVYADDQDGALLGLDIVGAPSPELLDMVEQNLALVEGD